MIIGITGTPGTGKTSISKVLEKCGYSVIYLNELALKKEFFLGNDNKRNSKIVDIEKLENYIFNKFIKGEFLFIEGHLSHLLSKLDKLIILRMHPKKLKRNLQNRDWNRDKINENIEAEILDIILCEAIENHNEKDIIELDVSKKTVDQAAQLIIDMANNYFKNIKKYKIGQIDWSEEILKSFSDKVEN